MAGLERIKTADVVLADGRAFADVSGAVGVPAFDFKPGMVSEMTLPAVDVDGQLADTGLLEAGAWLRVDGSRWDVAAVERNYPRNVTLTARSAFGRRLRNLVGPETWDDITPAQWLRGRAKAAGGSAVVQPGAKARKIRQKRGESVLGVLASLASETGVEWVEGGDDVIYCGTPWWAFTGGPGLPTWKLVARGQKADLLSITTRSSLDDRLNAADAPVTMLPELARRMRPWHRVELLNAIGDDEGLWLVQDVSFSGKASEAASVTLVRPLKSSPKRGSTSQGNAGSDVGTGDLGGSVGAGDWVPGADKVWQGCTRTPRQMVAAARGYVGQYRWAGYCMTFVSVLAQGRAGGPYYAKDAWYDMPAGTPHGSGDPNAPAGSVVVWSGPNVAGHIAISLGGGRMISTTGGAIQEMGLFDYVGRGTYLGWMAPAGCGNS